MPQLGKPLSRSALIAFALLGVPITVLSALVGYRVMTSFYAHYDDEGYFLISTKEWLEQGQLYDEVYSQYGPAYSAILGGLFQLFGGEVDHDTGRLITLLVWLAISLVCALVALRLTGSAPIALATQVLCFVTPFAIRQEPPYPGGLLALLIVAIGAAALLVVRRPRAGLFAVGAVAATAVLVKINVGGFALIAAATACACAIAPPRGSPALRLGFAALAAATPLLVTASEWDRSQVLGYALTVSAAAAAVVIASPRLAPNRGWPLRRGGWLIVGATAAGALILGLAVIRGSSPAGLVEGVILDPLDHREIVEGRLGLPQVGSLLTYAGLFGAIALLVVRASGRSVDARPAIAAGVRISVGLVTWALAIRASQGDWTSFAAVGAFAWVAAVPPGDRALGPTEVFLRTLLPLVAVLNLMQAYPVVGAHLMLSVIPMIVVAAVCIADGLSQLALTSRARTWLSGAVAAGFAVWLALGPAQAQFDDALTRYREGTPLNLLGAEHLRVPAGEQPVYAAITDELRRRCDTFVTVPGLNSFYLWSGIEPPTGLNIGVWPWVLDDEEQQRIVDRVDPDPDACVLFNEIQVEFWSGERPVPEGPLLDWTRTGFEPVWSADPWVILQRRPARG